MYIHRVGCFGFFWHLTGSSSNREILMHRMKLVGLSPHTALVVGRSFGHFKSSKSSFIMFSSSIVAGGHDNTGLGTHHLGAGAAISWSG